MSEWINNLKQVVLVVLVCEFLKELLSTSSYRKYVQFAISLFLFFFLFSSLFRLEFSFPEWDITLSESNLENLLIPKYEERISEEIKQELSNHQLQIQEVSVQMNPQYQIESITIVSSEDPQTIQSVWKGDVSYEVVPPTAIFER